MPKAKQNTVVKTANRHAFTLIELLIVVAIISILASIALPNFLEAQTRAKVTRVKADMHSLIIAVETYRVDNNNYPIRRNTQATDTKKPAVPEACKRLEQMSVLTTPVAYISSLFPDIFESFLSPPNNIIDFYDPTQTSWLINSRHKFWPERQVSPDDAGWLMVSVGPDKYLGAIDNTGGWPSTFLMRGTVFYTYDPTNGTGSVGNIYGGQKGGLENAGQILYDKVF